MKKIVVLGGGPNQMPLIKEAKSLGYRVVLCDFRDNVLGISLADIHYQVNTLNYDEVLDVCVAERPDGIVTNSEPAVPIATKVACTLGLPGNTEESIEKLMSKNKFRHLQEKLGLFCPKFFLASSIEEVNENLPSLEFPIIIKPCECSGSRGSRRINCNDSQEIEGAFNTCMALSRNSAVEVEEFIEMPSLTTIEGEIFIHKGQILWNGLFYTTRSEALPMVPMTYTAPLSVSNEKLVKVKEALSLIFNGAGILHGEFNIEGYFTKDDEFFVVEINARQGGLFLPSFVSDSTGINYSKLLVSTSVGDNVYWNDVINSQKPVHYVIQHAVYSRYAGRFLGLSIDDSVKKYITKQHNKKQIGYDVQKSESYDDIVAIINFSFESLQDQIKVFDKMDKLITVKVMDEGGVGMDYKPE